VRPTSLPRYPAHRNLPIPSSPRFLAVRSWLLLLQPASCPPCLLLASRTVCARASAAARRMGFKRVGALAKYITSDVAPHQVRAKTSCSTPAEWARNWEIIPAAHPPRARPLLASTALPSLRRCEPGGVVIRALPMMGALPSLASFLKSTSRAIATRPRACRCGRRRAVSFLLKCSESRTCGTVMYRHRAGQTLDK
jgi:hypothetical protein